MPTLSIHVLDLSLGRPAAEVRVRLHGGGDRLLADQATGPDGRIPRLGPELETGPHRIVVEVGDYFGDRGHLMARVALEVDLGEGHHHVPVLLSPYSCTVYRGS